LVFDDTLKYYEAPFQVKANGGILLIDDFGRQQVRPRDLLNRWIVPLENRIDYMTMHTGRKFEVPFDVLVIFSTNLPPKDLVDEAFLRRLRHKIEIVDPTVDEFREIFKRVAEAKGVKYSEAGLTHLLKEYYVKGNHPLRANHPRDLADQILDISRYMGKDPEMTPELIDRAVQSYFVELVNCCQTIPAINLCPPRVEYSRAENTLAAFNKALEQGAMVSNWMPN